MRSGYCEGLNRDQIVKIARLTGCKNFVGKRKKFIFNAFVDLKPVERFENGSDYVATASVAAVFRCGGGWSLVVLEWTAALVGVYPT